jgi:hypothetical protein
MKVNPPLVTASEDKIPVVTAWSVVCADASAIPYLHHDSTDVSAASSPQAVLFLSQNKSGLSDSATCFASVESEVKEPPSIT